MPKFKCDILGDFQTLCRSWYNIRDFLTSKMRENQVFEVFLIFFKFFVLCLNKWRHKNRLKKLRAKVELSLFLQFRISRRVPWEHASNWKISFSTMNSSENSIPFSFLIRPFCWLQRIGNWETVSNFTKSCRQSILRKMEQSYIKYNKAFSISGKKKVKYASGSKKNKRKRRRKLRFF